MPWANEKCRAAAEAAIAATSQPDAELPVGDHEIRLGIDGALDGMQFSAGLHGRLLVRKNHHHPEQLLTAAVALLVAKVPAAARAKLLRDLPKLAAAADPESLPHTAAAGKLLRALRRKAGVEWTDTPSYKPRG